METVPGFVGFAALVVMSPGPDLMLVTRSVLGSGRRGGLLTALGVATGSAAWALAAAVGLVALLSASPEVLGLTRWLGAGYLAWIGLRAIMARAASDGVGPASATPAGRSWVGPFRVGVFGNVLHPGQAVFYTSMLPQFVDPAQPAAPQLLLLGGLFVAIVLTWFSIYAVMAGGMRPGRWLRIAPILNRITGVVLIGFAVKLVTRW